MIKILSLFTGISKSLPILGDMKDNIKSLTPKEGKVDYVRLAGVIFGYSLQFFIVYMIAKGMLEAEQLEILKDAFKIVK
jgi:hypothetical protein